MKKFNKIILIGLVSLFSFQVFGQSFALKGGLSMANMLAKDNALTYSDNFKMKMGFHVGVTTEFSLSDLIGIETGLLLNTKGYKTEESAFGVTMESVTSAYYLDIPILVKPTFDLGGLKAFVAAGPYVGIGLTGKTKSEYSDGTNTEEEEYDIEWGSDAQEDDVKRLDFGLSLGGGVEINNIIIGASYDLGLANISSYTEDGTITKNKVAKITVGYRF